jgi:DNA-binding MarR family transcriptional regulator
MASVSDIRQVLDSFRSIVQALRMNGRHAGRGARLSSAQLFALQRIAERPNASINDVAALTFTHQSSVSVVVQKLVGLRLVAKVTSSDDRRRQSLVLTAAGRRLLDRTPAAVQERVIDAIGALPKAERRALARSLGKVARAVVPEAELERPPMFFEHGAQAFGKAEIRRRSR